MIKTALFGTSRCQNGTEWHLFFIQDHPVISRSNLQPGIISHETLSRVKRSPFEDGGSAISTTDLRLRVFPVPWCNLPFGSRKCKSNLKKIPIFLFSVGRGDLVPGQETQNDGFFDSKMDK